MNTVKNHYQSFLSKHYSWMLGDFNELQQEHENFFERNGIASFTNQTALDLGAGNGIQSISLAKLGFKVTAVDFDRLLLAQLRKRVAAGTVHIREEEILIALKDHPKVHVIVCMGDTISHFPQQSDLEEFLHYSYLALEARGKLVVSFRSYPDDMTGTKKIYEVRSDEEKKMICEIDIEKDGVLVTDRILFKKQSVEKTSSYRKLRIDPNDFIRMALACGFMLSGMQEFLGMNCMFLKK